MASRDQSRFNGSRAQLIIRTWKCHDQSSVIKNGFFLVLFRFIRGSFRFNKKSNADFKSVILKVTELSLLVITTAEPELQATPS